MKHEKAAFYFRQFWAFYNPEMLVHEELRNELFKIYELFWRKVPDTVENKTMIVGRKYKQFLSGTK